MAETAQETLNDNDISVVEEVQLSPAEEKALSSGWMPEEDWVEQGNDPDDWVDAKTFNRNGEFMNRIHKQRREIDDLKRAIQELKGIHTNIANMERQKVMAELKKAKSNALEDGDYDTVVEIDEKISEVRADTRAPKDQPQVNPADAEAFKQWSGRNSWYFEDPDMRVVADNYGQRLHQQGMDVSDVLTKVEEHIRSKFPQNFENPKRTQSAVAGSSGGSTKSTGRGKSKYTINDLPEDAQRVARLMQRTGAMSIDDYVKSYMTGEAK